MKLLSPPKQEEMPLSVKLFDLTDGILTMSPISQANEFDSRLSTGGRNYGDEC